MSHCQPERSATSGWRCARARVDWHQREQRRRRRAAVAATGHNDEVTVSRPAPIAEVLLRRLETLEEVARNLIGAVSPADITRVVMDLVDTPTPATSRGLWLTLPPGVLRLVEHRGFSPTTAEMFERIPLDSELPGAVANRSRQTIVSPTRRHAEEAFDDLAGVERSAECFVAIPLLLERRCVGVLGLGYDCPPAADDLSFLEALAGQVAQAFDRVRLADFDRRRREAIEFLADLTDEALNAADHVDLMRRVTSAAVPELGDWCALTFIPTNGDPPHIEVAHIDPAKVEWAKELQDRYPYDPDSDSGVAQVIRSGETEFIADVTQQLIDEVIESSAIDRDEARSIVEALDLTSVITVPLRTKRRTVGAIQFVTAESGRCYDEDDVDLAEAVAGRLAEPLDNAWYADEQQRMSEALQRSLLPPRLPDIAGVEVAVGYWPAGVTAVGGDFYDLFEIGERRWAIVIGDACGSGPDSAALTGIVRHTVRAAARHGHTPAEVMDWVNEAVLKSDRDLFCTVCLAFLTHHDDGFVVETVNAGHPLPILLTDAGAVVLGKPGTLTGVFESITVTTTATSLGTGDSVVFYTDGITDLPPPYGMTAESLNLMVGSLHGTGSAAGIADGIHALAIKRVPEHRRIDDAAILIVRIAG
jgi:serine phosphatase RsbU (regulator of sigma subunit)